MSESRDTVLVTGGAQGIGSAIVNWFRSRGHPMIAVDSDGDAVGRHIEELDAGTTWLQLDVRDTACILAEIDRQGPRPRILVNNAAVARPKGLLSLSQPDMDEIFAINVFAGLHLMRGLAEDWIDRSVPGAVVNLASVNGIRAVSGMLMYNATKAAVISVTQSAALELAPHGIRINAVAPGSTLTGAWAEWPPATREHFASINPMGRFASAEEVANVVGFLAGPESAYMTGACVVVDGGLTAGLPS